MITEIFKSPSALILGVFILSLVLGQVIGDIRETLDKIKTKKALQKYKTKSRVKLSIFVEIRNTKELNTLRSLSLSSYKNLEVIVLYKTKAKSVLRELKKLQRQKTFKMFRIINKTNRLNHLQLIKKYSTGSAVMFLPSDSLLDQGYLSKAIDELRSGRYQAVKGLILHYSPATLGQLINNVKKVFQYHLERTKNHKSMFRGWCTYGVIYKKASLLPGGEVNLKVKNVSSGIKIIKESTNRPATTTSLALFLRKIIPMLLIVVSFGAIGFIEGYERLKFSMLVYIVAMIITGTFMLFELGKIKLNTLNNIISMPFVFLPTNFSFHFSRTKRRRRQLAS
jgi:hypothetical protein